MPVERPIITIDPTVSWGRPTVKGISTEAVASMVMAGEDLTTVADDYDLSRHEVLLACWWEGTQGRYRKLWREWAEEAGAMLGGWRRPMGVDAIPDPPGRDTSPDNWLSLHTHAPANLA